jgi:hypothetical protein
VEAGCAQPSGGVSVDQLMTRLRNGGPGTMKLTTNVNAASLSLHIGHITKRCPELSVYLERQDV